MNKVKKVLQDSASWVVLVLLVGAMAISQPFLIPFAAVFSFSRSHSSE